MTEKEKAKAYDEAIERAKKLYDNGITEEIFPELNEDDTERIRKNCIHFLELQKQHHAATFEIEECIDWLETQGEQKPTLPKWKYKKDNTPLLRDSIILNKYGGVAKSPSGAIVSDAWVLDYDELAKLPKEEKIEPKFKVGDWIITPKNKVLQITSIDDTSYCDEQCRFWTIEDAKDGDVLATSAGAFIYNGNNGGGGCPGSYCGINTLGNFQMGVEHHWTGKKVYPATKAQCDFLMKAMKAARYEWDSEKKELKKLVEPKFKVGDKITNSFRKYVGASGSQAIISEITEDKYIFTDGSYIFISNQDSWELVSDKKPKFDPETMKTYNDINIGDTVYIWGSGDSSVDETTITEKYDDRDHWNLKFSNGCVGRALKNGTSSTMGMYACLVYSDKEAVRESINERIKILSNIKI